MESFYSNPLATNSSNPIDFNEEFNAFVADLQIPQLTPEELSALESNLTPLEQKNVLRSFQNNISPGEDGFSKEFYETFFDLIGLHLLNSYNEAFNKGHAAIVNISEAWSYLFDTERRFLFY